MVDFPTGTATFLFTDIEGSTRLLQRLGEAYQQLLSAHHALMRTALRAGGGHEVKTEGDSFFVVFSGAGDALRSVVDAQRGLAAQNWPGDAEVRVRMGMHTGEATLVDGEYVGLDIHRAARIAAAGHGGQVLISQATRDLVSRSLPDGVTLKPLGEHRLKDLDQPERLYQVSIEGLRGDFAPIRSLSSRVEALPPELTAFIGRQAELQRVGELLAGTRLLTLTGPGGTGKTRLSLQAARTLGSGFHDGVAFVPLAPITDPRLVVPTIRQTLGFPEEVGRGSLETLLDQTRELDLLIVLDNFEQVVSAAETVAQILEGTTSLKLIVTSRAPLHVTGEQEMPVPPLRLPEGEGRDDPAIVSQSEAVALFVQRARTVRPDFNVTPQNARAIVEICERLDGLPLAIELAASRIRLLPPEALRARLAHRLDLLQSTAADRTDRQRTLRGAIDWSHELLGPDERVAFRRLGIFVGGWEIEDAEAVLPTGGGLSMDVFDALSALADNSLVRTRDLKGSPRFEMLETIREFAIEQLVAAGEIERVGRAHADRFAAIVEERSPRFTAALEVLDATERDHDNIRAALRWAIDHGEAELAMLTGGRLWRFWHLHNHMREGRRLLAEILEMPGAQAPTRARAVALNGMASVLYWMNEFDAARRGYDEMLTISRASGDRPLLAEALYSLGYMAAIPGDYDAARRYYRESLELYEQLNDRLGTANARFGVAFADYLDGHYVEAVEGLRQAVRDHTAVGDVFSIRNSSQVLGRALQFLGDYDGAFAALREALDRIVESGDLSAVATAFQDAAAIIAARGDPALAVRLVGASYAIHEEIGVKAPPTLVKILDPLARARAELSEAEVQRLLEEGRHMPREEALRIARGEGPATPAPAESTPTASAPSESSSAAPPPAEARPSQGDV